MTHKANPQLSSSAAIEADLGRRIEAIRLDRNITQSRLARQAGVSRSTISRLARPGDGISLDSFIRILQALELHDQLEMLIPDPGVRPLQRLSGGSQTRKRARAPKDKDNVGQDTPWRWADDDGDSG